MSLEWSKSAAILCQKIVCFIKCYLIMIDNDLENLINNDSQCQWYCGKIEFYNLACTF